MLFEQSSIAKLADFGLSKWKGDSKISLTKGVGTPAYMAPEAIGGHSVLFMSDMYSMGVTLYELMAQQTPNILVDIVP